MSVKDDLLRNRRVFELLTEPEGGADGASSPHRKSTLSQSVSVESHDKEPVKPFEPEPQELRRQSFRPQHDEAQKTETFSLEFGRRVRRETGMALNPPSLEAIAFPELRKASAPIPSDPLESLYHRLESEARRASQLLGEEEY